MESEKSTWKIKNEADIELFLKDKKSTSRKKVQPSTIVLYRRLLTNLSNRLQKPFREATNEDYQDIFDNENELMSERYRNNNVVLARDLYRFLYDLDVGERLPDCIRKFHPRKIVIDHMEYRKRVVTQEEFEKLMECAIEDKDSQEQAILDALDSFGQRKGAIQSLRVGQVSYDGTFTRLAIGKDKHNHTDDAVINKRCEFLMDWVESKCPLRNNPDAPLFCVHKLNDEQRKARGYKPKKRKKSITQYTGVDGELYEAVKKNFSYDMLKRFTERKGLRHIHPHDFKHTKTTNELSKGTPNTHIATLMGWSKATKMFSQYDHSDSKDYEKWLIENNAIPEKPSYKVLEQKSKEVDKQKEQISNIEKITEEYKGLVDHLVGEVQNLRAEIDKHNEAEAEQQDYEMRQKIENEWQDREAKIRAFKEGSDIILKKMIANGRSSKEISRYKQNIKHGLKLF